MSYHYPPGDGTVFMTFLKLLMRSVCFCLANSAVEIPVELLDSAGLSSAGLYAAKQLL